MQQQRACSRHTHICFLFLPGCARSCGDGWITRFVPLSSGKTRTAPIDEDVIVNVASDDITDDIVAADSYKNLSADGQPIKAAAAAHKAGPAVDPSTLAPHAVTPSDTSMGVITVMGMEVTCVQSESESESDRFIVLRCCAGLLRCLRYGEIDVDGRVSGAARVLPAARVFVLVSRRGPCDKG